MVRTCRTLSVLSLGAAAACGSVVDGQAVDVSTLEDASTEEPVEHDPAHRDPAADAAPRSPSDAEAGAADLPKDAGVFSNDATDGRITDPGGPVNLPGVAEWPCGNGEWDPSIDLLPSPDSVLTGVVGAPAGGAALFWTQHEATGDAAVPAPGTYYRRYDSTTKSWGPPLSVGETLGIAHGHFSPREKNRRVVSARTPDGELVVFFPETGEWSRAPVPAVPGRSPCGVAGAEANGDVIAGCNFTSELVVLRAATGFWESVPLEPSLVGTPLGAWRTTNDGDLVGVVSRGVGTDVTSVTGAHYRAATGEWTLTVLDEIERGVNSRHAGAAELAMGSTPSLMAAWNVIFMQPVPWPPLFPRPPGAPPLTVPRPESVRAARFDVASATWSSTATLQGADSQLTDSFVEPGGGAGVIWYHAPGPSPPEPPPSPAPVGEAILSGDGGVATALIGAPGDSTHSVSLSSTGCGRVLAWHRLESPVTYGTIHAMTADVGSPWTPERAMSGPNEGRWPILAAAAHETLLVWYEREGFRIAYLR